MLCIVCSQASGWMLLVYYLIRLNSITVNKVTTKTWRWGPVNRIHNNNSSAATQQQRATARAFATARSLHNQRNWCYCYAMVVFCRPRPSFFAAPQHNSFVATNYFLFKFIRINIYSDLLSLRLCTRSSSIHKIPPLSPPPQKHLESDTGGVNMLLEQIRSNIPRVAQSRTLSSIPPNPRRPNFI